MQAVKQTRRKMETFKSQIDGYSIEISTDVDLALLEQDWLSLESKQSVPYFLSWNWVSCWIETYQPDLIVVSAFRHEQLVCIGLFTQSIDRRHFFIHSHQLRLNQTGNHKQDQIWVEFNDFLSTPDHSITAADACLKALLSYNELGDEIIFSMTTKTRAHNIQEYFPAVFISDVIPCYISNLQKIRENNQSFLESLSSNTRYQVRRSIRLYESEYGKLELTQAQDKHEAIALFHEAGEFHKLRWEDSGYSNPEFVKFHENLINRNFDQDQIKLLKISAGDRKIGILYYQVYEKTVYFYLQGLKQEQNPKLKPGLVSHAMACQYFLELGINFYDYMGGYSQYKEQLAEHKTDLVSICIQQPKIIFAFEKVAKSIKNALF